MRVSVFKTSEDRDKQKDTNYEIVTLLATFNNKNYR